MMEYVHAALLLHEAGKEINEDNLKKVMEAAGITPDEARIKVLVDSLKDVNIDEAIAQAPTAVVTAAPAAAEEKKEEKKEEEKKEEEEKASEEAAVAGLSALFG